MYAQGTVLRGGAPYGAAAGAAGNGYYNYGQKPVKQSKAYVSLGAIDYNIGESAYGVQGRLGYNFSPLFGAELEVSTGVAKEFVGVGSSVGIDYSVGGFAVARAPLGSKFSLLARGGYHVTKFGVTTPAISGTVSMDGFALGLGAEYAFTPKNALRLDYTRYGMRQLGNSTGAASLSYVRKF
ncbi:MAG: hypothetical protein COA69_06105 [Robiginitomaculum sp.]|nr:MAG: hypothetical protein COA69_06105 [Robiginitomaculum sp.]